VAGDAGTRYDLVVDWCYEIELAAVTTGSITATAIVHELCDDDDEIALERKETVQGLF
jgi:hypothetical protein